MALNITNNYSNPQVSILQKFHNAYKNNEVEKKVTHKNNLSEITQPTDIQANEIREYLSVDEKRVLKEVFGDLSVDKKTNTPYSCTKSVDFLKGSQIDIRL